MSDTAGGAGTARRSDAVGDRAADGTSTGRAGDAVSDAAGDRAAEGRASGGGGQTTAVRGAGRALEGRRRKYEAEVEQLVTAAFAVMSAKGTASPTVADILAEAGLSTAAFYRHFPTKDDLLVTLLERAHETTHEHLRRRLDDEAVPADRVAAWVRGMFDLLATPARVAANRPFLLAHPRLLERFPDEITAGIDRLVALLADVVAEARGEAGLARGDPATDARLAFHQVFGLLIDHAALDRPVTATTVAQVTAYTLRATLAP